MVLLEMQVQLIVHIAMMLKQEHTIILVQEQCIVLVHSQYLQMQQ